MNTQNKKFGDRLTDTIPDVPEQIHDTTVQMLDDFILREKIQAAQNTKTARRGFKRPTLAFVLIAMLLLGSVAFAAIHFNIFDTMIGTTPKNAAQIMKANLHQETVNNVEITIKEAGYDGRTMYLLYSYRMLDVDTVFGIDENGNAVAGISEEPMRLLSEHHVGWWVDHIWFDGKCMDAPNNSSIYTTGSDVPGEIVQYESWRLDNEETFLSGNVEISLPIGEKQPLENYQKQLHPEMYGDDGRVLLPTDGMVTFTLDVADVLGKVVETTPNITADLPDLTAKVSNVAYTPVMMYVTLEAAVKQEKLDAFIAQNGEGHYLDGKLLWPYSGADVFANWITQLYLVDGDGNEVFPNMAENNGYIYGNNGYSDSWAEYLFPYADTYPSEMWLAPKTAANTFDLAQAVQVR
ncbi:MAG: DUF4179 domain-containing protein [Clostridiales bacterium]|nr:DUF4179 domain-containing protein [Clostridiales bacterium]